MPFFVIGQIPQTRSHDSHLAGGWMGPGCGGINKPTKKKKKYRKAKFESNAFSWSEDQ